VAPAGHRRQCVTVIDPAIESHYGTGYERSRLFRGGRPSLEYVRSMELLERLLPAPPARVLDVGGGPGAYAAPLARRGYRVHLVDPVPLHVEQARQAGGADPAAGFTAALGDARELAGFTGVTVYGVEGPGWPLRQQWADPRRREHILFAARSVETQPSLIGFSDHLIAAATKP
jgi:SAM-dependent methyltransferase